MNLVAKQLVDEDGEVVPVSDQVWHLVWSVTGDSALFCTGEYVEEGCGNGEYELRYVERGRITCPKCIKQIKDIRSVKLR